MTGYPPWGWPKWHSRNSMSRSTCSKVTTCRKCLKHALHGFCMVGIKSVRPINFLTFASRSVTVCHGI